VRFLAQAPHVPAAYRGGTRFRGRDVVFDAGSAAEFRRQFAEMLGRLYPPDAIERKPLRLRLLLTDRFGRDYAEEFGPNPSRPIEPCWLPPRFLSRPAAEKLWRDALATASRIAWIDRQLAALVEFATRD
jgi:hypothetical protein